MRLLVLTLAIALGVFDARGQSIAEVEAAFDDPPASARPWVFWYWMHGRVSAEGVTADLEAMRKAGLSGAYLMPIQGPTDPPEYEPVANQLSPRFWRLVRHAAREAHRLGLELGMHVCDGFATAGGPWITPELSMQRLVWSTTVVEGGGPVERPLPLPPTTEGYYRDVAVVALPKPTGYGRASSVTPTRVSTSDGEADANRLASAHNERRYRSESPCWIEYEYARPFAARSVTVTPDGRNYQCQRLRVEALVDDAWRTVARLDAPRHGWQDDGAPVTHSLPETTAHRFRFSWTPEGSEPGAEDLDAAKWAPVLKVQSIVLSSEPRVHQHRGKNASLWRRSPATTDEQAPRSLCTPLEEVLDLTSHLDDDGNLSWRAPPGDWLVLRFGHTSTGQQNTTGGGARGLECDKLNPEAVRLQFDRWFGEAQRQIADELGEDVGPKVLTTLHVDSWECGAQNWTAGFLQSLANQNSRQDPSVVARWLPTMAGIPIESAADSERFLRTVRATLAEPVAERFFGTLRSLADEKGLRFSAECTAPTMPGDGMRHFAFVDRPMGEFWLDSPTHDKPTDMLDAIHGARRFAKRVVQAEAFTQLRIGWDETPATLKRLGDRHFALGANRFVIHVWTHNPWLDRKPGQTLGGVGLYFQRDQPWVEAASGWTDYLSRCQAVLQAGSPVVDVAVELTDDYPRRAATPHQLIDELPGLIGEKRLAGERARRANAGQPQRERPVGVRASANIPSLADWADPLRGYEYVSVGPSEDRTADRFTLATRLGRSEPWTDADLTGVGAPRDFVAYEADGSPADDVAWTHRRGDGWDAYFISNQRDAARSLQVSLRATGNAVEIWDPLTGSKRLVNAQFGERTELDLRLLGYGSMLVVIRPSGDAPRSGGDATIQELTGPWTVRFESAAGETPAGRRLEELRDLTRDPDLAGFAGVACYSGEFDLGREVDGDDVVWLDLGDAAAVAEVSVNGVNCGVAWTDPWRVDITGAVRQKGNTLVVRTPSTWKNALVADRNRSADDRRTWTSAPVRLSNETPTPFGLFGPINLLREKLHR